MGSKSSSRLSPLYHPNLDGTRDSNHVLVEFPLYSYRFLHAMYKPSSSAEKKNIMTTNRSTIPIMMFAGSMFPLEPWHSLGPSCFYWSLLRCTGAGISLLHLAIETFFATRVTQGNVRFGSIAYHVARFCQCLVVPWDKCISPIMIKGW